jgi:cation diffusion facilitator family transporter
VVVVEAVGAWLSGSLALLADAGHMLTDAAGIVIALLASLIATRPANARRTFGYHRAEIFAAVLNALVLFVVCAYLAYAGTRRLFDPADLDARQMLVFAGIGLASNAVSVGLLTARRDSSLNMKGAYLEVLTDTFGSVLAVAAGVLVLTTGFLRADPIASLVIAALVLPRAWALLVEAGAVLLEAAPRGLDVDDRRCRHTSRSPRRPSPRAGSVRSSTTSPTAWRRTSASTTPPSRSSPSRTATTSTTPSIRERSVEVILAALVNASLARHEFEQARLGLAQST